MLTTSRGYESASAAGITGNPQHSPRCLKCHATGGGYTTNAFLETFDLRDGVQCESCHGPGSDYASKGVMQDEAAARAKGLRKVSVETCRSCHRDSSKKKFDFAAAVKKIAHPIRREATANAAPRPQYKNPLNLALTPEGKQLWVACEASASVIVVDTATRQKVAEIPR